MSHSHDNRQVPLPHSSHKMLPTTAVSSGSTASRSGSCNGSSEGTLRFTKYKPTRRLLFRTPGDIMRTKTEFRVKVQNTIYLLGCLTIFAVIVVGGSIGGVHEAYRDRIAVAERG